MYFSQYLEGKTLQKTVRRVKRELKDVDFTALAVTGISGLLVGAPLTAAMGKKLLVVRKRVESAHSERRIETPQNSAREKVIIFDDFIESGRTVRNIYRKLQEFAIEPDVIGIFLYNLAGSNSFFRVAKGVELPVLSYKECEYAFCKSEGKTYSEIAIS